MWRLGRTWSLSGSPSSALALVSAPRSPGSERAGGGGCGFIGWGRGCQAVCGSEHGVEVRGLGEAAEGAGTQGGQTRGRGGYPEQTPAGRQAGGSRGRAVGRVGGTMGSPGAAGGLERGRRQARGSKGGCEQGAPTDGSTGGALPGGRGRGVPLRTPRAWAPEGHTVPSATATPEGRALPCGGGAAAAPDSHRAARLQGGRGGPAPLPPGKSARGSPPTPPPPSPPFPALSPGLSLPLWGTLPETSQGAGGRRKSRGGAQSCAPSHVASCGRL